MYLSVCTILALAAKLYWIASDSLKVILYCGDRGGVSPAYLASSYPVVPTRLSRTPIPSHHFSHIITYPFLQAK